MPPDRKPLQGGKPGKECDECNQEKYADGPVDLDADRIESAGHLLGDERRLAAVFFDVDLLGPKRLNRDCLVYADAFSEVLYFDQALIQLPAAI